mmetsp:Transcript_43087/g.100972  ORF Transcript_43087/g.100972 Transcript_43087/m.100972 type:complete len:314 (-) Transcript_43087:23-964(-)
MARSATNQSGGEEDTSPMSPITSNLRLAAAAHRLLRIAGHPRAEIERCVENMLRYAQRLCKHPARAPLPRLHGLQLSEVLHRHLVWHGGAHEVAAADAEGRDRVHAELLEQSLRPLDLCCALVGLEEQPRVCLVDANARRALDEHRPVVELPALLEMAVVEVGVQALCRVDAGGLCHVLHEPVCGESGGGDPVQVKLGDPHRPAPLLEPVPLLLREEALLAPPLPVEPYAVGLLKPLRVRVPWLEEERHSQHREGGGLPRLERRPSHLAHRSQQAPLPDVAIGSHHVGDELNVDAPLGGGCRQQTAHGSEDNS